MQNNFEKYLEFKDALSNEELRLIIFYALSHWNLVKLVNKHDLNKSNIKTSKISTWNLAGELSENAFSNNTLLNDLGEMLTLYSAEAREAIKNSDLKGYQDSLDKEKKRIKKIKTARLIWALLMIPSKEKKILGKNMIRGLHKEKKGPETTKQDMADGEKEEPGLTQSDNNKENKFTKEKKKQESKPRKKFTKDVDETKDKKETKRLNNTITSLKKEIAALNRKINTNKNLEKIKEMEEKLRHLETERREAKERLEKDFVPKEYFDALKKENDKLYQFVKASRNGKGIKTLNKNSSTLFSLFENFKDIPFFKKFFRNNQEDKVGIFVDVQNMFYSAKNLFHGRLDFEKFLNMALHGRKLVKAIAYIVKTPEIDQSKFINLLKNNDYNVKTLDLKTGMNGFAKGNWDVGIVMDIFELADQLDVIVLASGDGDFVPLVKYLQKRGIRVEVYGFSYNTAIDLKECADIFYPIQEDILIKDARGVVKQH